MVSVLYLFSGVYKQKNETTEPWRRNLGRARARESGGERETSELRSVEFAGRHLPTLVNERQHKKFKAPSASLPSSKVGIRVLRNYQEARQWSFLRVEINGRETSLGMKVGAHLRARTHACAPPVSACMVRAHALAHTRTQRTHSYMHKHAHLHTYQGFDQVSVWSSYFRGGIYLAERHPPAKKPRACLYYERVSVGVEVECERERA